MEKLPDRPYDISPHEVIEKINEIVDWINKYKRETALDELTEDINESRSLCD